MFYLKYFPLLIVIWTGWTFPTSALIPRIIALVANTVIPTFISDLHFYLPRQRCGRGNSIGPVFPSFCLSVCQFVSTLTAEPFDVYIMHWMLCIYRLCLSIHHGKRTLGRRNFTTRVAGGASTLRRFHSFKPRERASTKKWWCFTNRGSTKNS